VNAEVAAIPETTRGNLNTAAMRFEFWRELVQSAETVSSGAAPHPLLPALQALLSGGKVSSQWLLRMIDARERDMDPQSWPYASLRDIEAFADDTQGAMLMCLLEAAGVSPNSDTPVNPAQLENAERCIAYIGRAVGLTTLLRGFPHHCARGDVYLPADILAKHQLTAHTVLTSARGIFNDQIDTASDTSDDEEAVLFKTRLSSAVFDVASLANAYAEDASKLGLALPASAESATTLLVPHSMWLKRLETTDFNLFRVENLQALPRFMLHWSLLRCVFRV
jgi:phytoene synthase